MSVVETDLHTLYSNHHGWLLNWLRKKLGCPHNAADLAQDAFIRLLGGHEAHYLREPRALLTTIARGLMIDHWRRQELERAYLDALAHLPEPVTPSPEVQLLVMELLAQIDALLDGLRPRIRTAFLMAQLDGLTGKQISVQLGVSERMVKKYLAEAMMHCLLLRHGGENPAGIHR